MTDDKYIATQTALIAITKMTKGLDLDGFIHRIEICEAAAPMLDPTAYIKAKKGLGTIKNFAVSLKAFQEAVEND